jgi:hypothetical protein
MSVCPNALLDVPPEYGGLALTRRGCFTASLPLSICLGVRVVCALLLVVVGWIEAGGRCNAFAPWWEGSWISRLAATQHNENLDVVRAIF